MFSSQERCCIHFKKRLRTDDELTTKETVQNLWVPIFNVGHAPIHDSFLQ